jgi:hypothetical protein
MRASSKCSALRSIDPEFGAVVAGDSTDLSAHANGQRYIRQGGPTAPAILRPDSELGSPWCHFNEIAWQLLRAQAARACLCEVRATHQLGLLELRVRRIERVTRHVTLLILAFSLLKLAKLRASP